jgi:hypothetical protein
MTHTTPLAQQVVGVAAAIREEAEAVSAHGGVVAVLHALFLSTLARLVGRLEHMILQWQAGQLPPQTPRRPRQAAEVAPGESLRATTPSRPDQARRTAPRPHSVPGLPEPIKQGDCNGRPARGRHRQQANITKRPRGSLRSAFLPSCESALCAAPAGIHLEIFLRASWAKGQTAP